MTNTSARPLTASSRNLSSVGSRHTTTCSLIVTSSAGENIRRTPSMNDGDTLGTKNGRRGTSNTCASVIALLRSPPYPLSQRTSLPGHDNCFNAALGNVDIDNDSHLGSKSSTSRCACLMSRSILSSDQAASITFCRENRRASAIQSSGSTTTVTCWSGAMPRGASSAANCPAVLSMNCDSVAFVMASSTNLVELKRRQPISLTAIGFPAGTVHVI
jgi:hypothetical protein